MIGVYTVGEICKKCYSCVRACPTKAIEVHAGQADIIESECISCGSCVTVCSQNAKRIRSSVEEALELLRSTERPRCAIIAPSFPAAFLGVPPEKLIAGLRSAGFDYVHEVAFGADLVSRAYRRKFAALVAEGSEDFMISSPCPAVVSYVEKRFPRLVPHLAPLASPMEATARVVRAKIAADAGIVFIGPCVAKKDEADRSGDVDVVLTFAELAEIFERSGISFETLEPSEFDRPQANLGRIYPVTGGLLKAAAIDSDLVESPVIIVEGRDRVTDILNVLDGKVRSGLTVVNRFFDLLYCEGCIAGPVMNNTLTFYERKKYIVDYMKGRKSNLSPEEWDKANAEYLEVDLSKSFAPYEVVEKTPTEEEIRAILAKTNKLSAADELNCRACGYASCRDKAVAVYRGTAEVEMCLPYLIAKLERTINDLQENQSRLIQAEKLASMGQIAAGIAHEINNPLGVVLMYSHLLKDDIDPSSEQMKDLNRIVHEAERTRKIVRGILNFAREEKIERRPTDIHELISTSADQILGSDGARTLSIVKQFDPTMKVHNVDGPQLRQVFDNLIKNSVEAMSGTGTITITTKEEREAFSVQFTDTGPGIAQDLLPKLFSPFVTSKPVGKGTGLGLAVCYGIVKMHGGTIQAGNNPEGGAFFDIRIQDATNAHKENNHG